MKMECGSYEGRGPFHSEVQGLVEGPDEAAIRHFLKSRGIHVHQLKLRDIDTHAAWAHPKMSSSELGNALLVLVILASLLTFALLQNLDAWWLAICVAPPRGAETTGMVTRSNAHTGRVEYVFCVDGKDHAGSGELRAERRPLPEEGQSITVYYAKENPAISFLHPEQPSWRRLLVLFVFALLCVCIAAFMMVGSRDNLCITGFLLRRRLPLFQKELASLSGTLALSLFFPSLTALAWFASRRTQDRLFGISNEVFFSFCLMASVTMAFVMVTALLVERAQKTRLVTEEYVAWCEQTAARKRAKAARPESPRRKAWGTIAGGLLWSIFSAVGFIPLGLPVLLHFPLWLSHSWEPVPCTILSSEHVRGVGFRYGPTSTFTYRYTFNGQTYTSSEYKLGLIRAGLPADTYRTGQTTTCYVTPRWPGHPVLKMAETWDAVQWMGIAILFAVWQAIGLAILGAGFVLLYRLGAPSG